MKKHNTSAISASVMDTIKSGKVRMKPRSYFTLLGIVSAGAVILAGVATTYLSSIVFFWARIQAADTMAYGARAKLSDLIASFPWWALIAAVVLTTLAVVLVRRHGHMYKHKTSTVAALIIACSLLVGLGLSFLDVGKSHLPNQNNGRGQSQGWQQNR